MSIDERYDYIDYLVDHHPEAIEWHFRVVKKELNETHALIFDWVNKHPEQADELRKHFGIVSERKGNISNTIEGRKDES